MAEQRASKSGIAAEAQKKVHNKFDGQLAKQIFEWISLIIGPDLMPMPTESVEMAEFIAALKDGSILCNLANSLSPNSIKKINSSGLAFKQMENIAFFLAFAEKYVNKNELFQTVDLYEGQDPNSVLICLSALARKSEKTFGKPGIGPKEAEGQRKQWSEDQLRAGETIIGLQAGSNKGANQSGMIMGNTRHM